jgi:hypothetical protein
MKTTGGVSAREKLVLRNIPNVSINGSVFDSGDASDSMRLV